MRRSATLFLILFTVVLNAQELSQHRWKNRLAILVSAASSEALLSEQIALLANNEDSLEDLKLLVYQFKDDSYSLGVCADKGWQAGSLPVFLAEKIATGAGFTFFVIGLDGSVKMQRNQLVSIEDLFGLIDQMPMRRAELRRKQD